MHKVVIITRQSRFEALKNAMTSIGVTGMTLTNVAGCGQQKGAAEYYRGVPVDVMLLPKIKLELVVSAIPVEKVVETARKALYTGHIGDGKIRLRRGGRRQGPHRRARLRRPAGRGVSEPA